jgi:hypothetical protein
VDGLPAHGVACYANALTFDSIALGEYHPVTTWPFLVVGAATRAVFRLMLLSMYRRRVLIRI